MLRRLVACSFLVAASSLTGQLVAQEALQGSVIVLLPYDARLFFDDIPTRQTGMTRLYTTPPLVTGSEYYYQLRAEITREGKVISQTRKVPVRSGDTTYVDFSDLDPAAAILTEPTDEPPATDRGWPRKIAANGNTITIYQPQVQKWRGNQLEAQAAVSVETKASPLATFGVMTITARTAVDKENRQVALDDIKITKAVFPTAPQKEEQYLSFLRSDALQSSRTIALDRIEANLAVTEAIAKAKTVAVKNDPPRILFTTTPSLLVLVDGKPALRQIAGNPLLRVINTRNLILFDEPAKRYYLRVMDRWMTAANVEGPWSAAASPPAALEQAMKLLSSNSQIDLLDNPAADIKDAFENGVVPTIFASTTPAELVESDGELQFTPIENGKLLWAKNAITPVFKDAADQNIYLLLSGRWFRARATDGPWEFVPANKLPADFARIPDTHPRGDVLASVAGTPQARQAMIANQVPQMATIARADATLQPTFDGPPRFEPIEGTPLQYATNAPTPVVRVDGKTYYAVENGVWFVAATPNGPWEVATSVPSVIYTIPPSSPIHYVTHVYVYGSTADVVYVGYTPGYFGTIICPEDVVVYGTGWYYGPWINNYWYGRPWTYGWGIGFGWTPGGWGFGIRAAYGWPWWGPIGWNAGWGGTHWRDDWRHGWGGRYHAAHINQINFANANVYHRWNDRTYVRPSTGGAVIHRGLNNVVATKDGNVFRKGPNNSWEHYTPKGWQPFTQKTVVPAQQAQMKATVNRLNSDWNARHQGETKTNAFRATTGHAVTPTYTPPTIRNYTPSTTTFAQKGAGANIPQKSTGPLIIQKSPSVGTTYRPAQPTFRPATPSVSRPAAPVHTGPAAIHTNPGGFRGTPARRR